MNDGRCRFIVHPSSFIVRGQRPNIPTRSVPRPALRTKLRIALGVVAAAGAFLLRRQRAAALLAELAALGFDAAVRADGAGDLRHVARLGPVDGARLLLHLLARGVGLRGSHLFVEIGRAVLAEAGLLVPADRLAD